MTPEHERYAAEAAVLAQIGQAVFTQPTRLMVRIPRVLADLAVTAWRREEDRPEPTPEAPEQAATRHWAGSLALIGLSIVSSGGGAPDGDDVLVDLDAWHIGAAFDAAENGGLLADAVRSGLNTATAGLSGHPVHLYAVLRADFYPSPAEPEARQAASSGPFQFGVIIKEVLPTAELARNEVRRLNELNQDKRCSYFWQVTRYYANGRKGTTPGTTLPLGGPANRWTAL